MALRDDFITTYERDLHEDGHRGEDEEQRAEGSSRRAA